MLLCSVLVGGSPVVGIIRTSAPVAVSGELFTFYADLTWPPDSQAQPVFWRVCRDHSAACEDMVDGGSFNASDDGVLLQEYSADISDDKLGKYHYHLQMSADADFLEGEDTSTGSFLMRVVPGVVTLIPPLITVFVAVSTRNVLLSLFTGIYFAALIIWNYNPFYAFINSFSDLIVSSFSDRDHIFIVLFTWILSGMISCIMKSGGGEGLVKSLSKYATSPRAGMLVAFSLGMMIFFDDYANTLIVGQTVRPIVDSLGVSREKLAFLVDSTAAPVASVSPISSWIGFELSLIEDALEMLVEAGEDVSCYDSSAFIIFLNTIPSRFYPMFVLSIQLFLILTGVEYGPMLACERKARKRKADEDLDASGELSGLGNIHMSDQEAGSVYAVNADADADAGLHSSHETHRHDRMSIEDNAHRAAVLKEAGDTAGAPELEPDHSTPKRWYNAVVPIAVTIILVLVSLVCTGLTGIRTGEDSMSLQNVFANSNSFTSLLYGSIGGTLTVWGMCWIERVTKEGELVTWFHSAGRLASSRPVMSFDESLDIFIFGIKNLVNALLILILAWTVGDSFTKCGTGVYISSALEDSVDAGAYPALTFVIRFVTSLSSVVTLFCFCLLAVLTLFCFVLCGCGLSSARCWRW
jgi:Na+/H+ antiporter NhaC